MYEKDDNDKCIKSLGQSSNCIMLSPLPNNEDCSGQVNAIVQKKSHTWGNCVYEKHETSNLCVKASDNSETCKEASDAPTTDDCSWWGSGVQSQQNSDSILEF